MTLIKDKCRILWGKPNGLLQLFIILLFSANTFAQQPKDAKQVPPAPPKEVKKQLSTHEKAAQKEAIQHQKDAERERKLKGLLANDSVLNNIGIDSILSKIEDLHITLDKINRTTAHGFNTSDIEDGLPEVDSNMQIINENILLYTSVLDVKNLQMFQALLVDMQAELNDWRTTLSEYDKKLVGMKHDLVAIRKDTVLADLYTDTSFKNLYLNELNDLAQKREMAVNATHENLTKVNKLQADVSNAYFESIDQQNKVNDLLRKFSMKALGKEYDYLWEVEQDTADKQVSALVRKSYQSQQKILQYYFDKNEGDRAWMILIGLLFIVWVYRNFRLLKKNDHIVPNATPKFRYIHKISILSALILILCIAPFFDLHPPSTYIKIISSLLVLLVTILFISKWPGRLFYYWVAIGLLYIIFAITGFALTPAFNFRIWLLILNIISIAFGIFFLWKTMKSVSVSMMIKTVTVVYIIWNIAAALCNLFGRLSISKILGSSAIFGLMQIIVLSTFIQILMESVQLQLMVSNLKGGLFASVRFDSIKKKLQNILTAVAVFLWLVVFTIGMDIYNLLFKITDRFLTSPRKMGNTTFEIGNIILFLVIIYVSNVLQKGVGALYDANEKNGIPTIDKNGSRLVITRLILLIIGFFLAVTASGLPVDKITIVLGALSVGIGLGLQSIVNNLVSGVILIFERPFRIGDYIELDNKKGRVRDIGIRSSKLITEEGAEIIMPNADLLSGRVVNWTLRDNNARIELPLTLEAGAKVEDIKQYITDSIAGNKNIIKGVEPEILLNSITDKSTSLSVLVWINDVHRMQAIKSELLNIIYGELAKHDIKMV